MNVIVDKNLLKTDPVRTAETTLNKIKGTIRNVNSKSVMNEKKY